MRIKVFKIFIFLDQEEVNQISIIDIVDTLKKENKRLSLVSEDGEIEILELDKKIVELKKDISLLEKTPYQNKKI